MSISQFQLNQSNSYKIKAVFADLDGTLVALKDQHYECLNQALKSVINYEIPYDQHLKYYDGKTTKTKLQILENRGLLSECHKQEIWRLKQQYTADAIDNFKPDPIKIDMCQKLTSEGFILACVSNSIRITIEKILKVIGILDYMTFNLGNEDFIFDGKNLSKPDPYCYNLAMNRLNLKPDECLILEDNFNGIQSAKRSGGWLYEVKEVDDVNYDNIINFIKKIEKNA